MNDQNPVLFVFAAVIVGCMGLVGLGLLFVRAENIERRNLVALVTLAGAAIAAVMLYFSWASPGRSNATLPVSAIVLSIFGFVAGRVIDLILGDRNPDAIEKDPATYGADLAD
jgi:hypothetical protein